MGNFIIITILLGALLYYVVVYWKWIIHSLSKKTIKPAIGEAGSKIKKSDLFESNAFSEMSKDGISAQKAAERLRRLVENGNTHAGSFIQVQPPKKDENKR